MLDFFSESLIMIKSNIYNIHMPRYYSNITGKPIGQLPVLTCENRDIYPKWHEYYESVYSYRVKYDVDLNNFNWFYWNAPISQEQRDNILSLTSIRQKINPGVAFIYNTPCMHTYGRSNVPAESQVGKAGFFVCREIELNKTNNSLIEVMRTTDSTLLEKGVAWFFITIGSGFWLNVGTICDIMDLCKIPNIYWNDADPFPTMKKHNINSVVRQITSAYEAVKLPELIFCLSRREELANHANLKLIHGDPDKNQCLKAKYDPIHHCLVK